MLLAQAYDAAGNVGSSTAVTVTVSNSSAGDTQPPTVPANLTATSGPRGSLSIALKWSASSDNVGVTGYQVWRSDSSGGTYTLLATTAGTTFTDTGLPRGVFRYYKVKAVDAAGNASGFSNTAGAKSR